MYSSIMIFIAWFFAWMNTKRPRILYKEYFVDNELVKTDVNDTKPILDPEYDNVDYICCTYSFGGIIYKVLVDDVFDLYAIDLTRREKISDCFIETHNDDEFEIEKTLNVTDIITQHAGPHQDFHNCKRLYRLMLPFTILGDNKLFLTIEMNGSHMIVEL